MRDDIEGRLGIKVADLVRQDLEGRLGDKLVFDPIHRRLTEVDHDDEDYLDITIIYDGDRKHLDSDTTVGLVDRITPRLLELGVLRGRRAGHSWRGASGKLVVHTKVP